MTRCLDIGRVLTYDQLVELRVHGDFAGVVPYLDPFNPKGATRTYLEDIYRAGLLVPGVFYQTTGGAGQGAAYFTRNQGRVDATNANELLARFGGLVPPLTIVWYAVDVNVAPSVIDEYANGIEDIADPALQRPGLYGYERLMRHARDAYPHMGLHLAQTYGAPIAGLDLWQHEQITIDGITVDVDEVSVAGWRPKEKEVDSPQYQGQSAASIVLRVGEVAPLQGIWRYADGRAPAQVEKVYALRVGSFPYAMYPKVDPDADETRDLGAQPALFVITVTDL